MLPFCINSEVFGDFGNVAISPKCLQSVSLLTQNKKNKFTAPRTEGAEDRKSQRAQSFKNYY
jgi:hypothetical protein